jgi:hypothetical protein
MSSEDLLKMAKFINPKLKKGEWQSPFPIAPYLPAGGLFPRPPPDGLPVVLGLLPALTPPPWFIVITCPFIFVCLI